MYFQKTFKRFFNEKSNTTVGSLYFLRLFLMRSDVNGNVKNNYQAHVDFFHDVCEELLIAQAMEYFKMHSKNDVPTQHMLPENIDQMSKSERTDLADAMLTQYLTEHHYGEAVLSSCGIEIAPDGQPDEMYNYCTQLCHWALHFFHMEDTAKEGDPDRLISNLKYSSLFFYSHSRLSHYLTDCIDFIIKTQYLLSPQSALRVLEGAFVNLKGGAGGCVETDLKVEHTVRLRKTLIRALGANKSEKAMVRATSAADAVGVVCDAMDQALHVKQKSARHSKRSSDKDRQQLAELYNELEPFAHTPGRKMPYCTKASVQANPLALVDCAQLKTHIYDIIFRILDGCGVMVEDGELEFTDEEE